MVGLVGIGRGRRPASCGARSRKRRSSSTAYWRSWDSSSARPQTRRPAKWAMACWIAGQIADGSLDPAAGAHLIWADVAYDLGYPEELEPLVHCAHSLDGW